MCGRYTIRKPGRLVAVFQPDIVDADIQRPRFNIAPMQTVPALILREDKRTLLAAQWGFVPHWARDPKIGNRMINARSETLTAKPAFKSAVRHTRCLIPADGFYEWKVTGQKKQPFHIHAEDDALFAFAGLYSIHDELSPDGFISCTIITTAAERFMIHVHDRMPVILNESRWNDWLDPAKTDDETIQGLLGSPSEKKMRMTMVSTLVNSPTNDGEQCIAECQPDCHVLISV
jgi:putative SOS response-associated peptidase YedK